MKLIKGSAATVGKNCLKHRTKITFFLLLAAFLFLRFYQLPERAVLGWDQADSAWAAKGILRDNPLRIEGVPIKGNPSMFMGSLYYYMITPFYYFTDLDMVAAPIFAGVASVISFFIFYNITKKLFDDNIAAIAAFVYTFSLVMMKSDREQAAFTLIPIVSYVIFYFLYRFITGSEKYIVYLAAAVGFGFHLHFTTIFYLPIILLTLPFFPKSKTAMFYTLLSIPVFLLFISPMLYSVFVAKGSGANGIIGYLHASYHGFHLKRFMQLIHDGVISFEFILQAPFLRPYIILVIPLFIYVFYFSERNKGRRGSLLFSYLIVLWVLIPWITLAAYNGELTNYYFSLPQDLAIAMVAFLLMSLYKRKALLLKLSTVFLLGLYAIYNSYIFLKMPPGNYLSIKAIVENAISRHEVIKFKDRDPIFYTYYIYTTYRKK